MNVLIVSSRAHIVPVVQALLQARVVHPNLFRIGDFGELARVLSYAHCDLLVVDARTSGYGASFNEATLRQQQPGLPIIVLDAGDLAPAAPLAASEDRLLRALRLISPDAELITPSPPETAPPPLALTARQLDVLHLLRRGCRTREIAAALGVTVPTVKSHLRALYRYLGATNRLQAVVKAVPLVSEVPRAAAGSVLRVVA